MALSAHDAFSAGRRRHRRSRARRGALSEINVTPLVDVMLVLLIIFMISAPLLTSGVELDLPRTDAGALQDPSDPLTISIRQGGEIFVGEEPVQLSGLIRRVEARAQGNSQLPTYIRGDAKAPYEAVAQVMGALSAAGYTRLNLITDTGTVRSDSGDDDRRGGGP